MADVPDTPPADAPTRASRILVMVGDDAPGIAAANVYHDRFTGHDLRFLEEKTLSPRSVLRFCRRRLRRKGLWSLMGVGLLYGAQCLRPAPKAPKRYQPALRTDSLGRDPAVLAYLRDFAPSTILVGFCGLLPPAFLRAVACPILNTHPGINPRYRGFGNIWAFRENRFDLVGYTVHRVDAGVDTGERLAVEAIDFDGVPFDESESHAAALAARRAASLVLGEARPSIPPEFADLPSACYGIPTWNDRRIARKNYERRYPAPHPRRTEGYIETTGQ